jgi:anti-sigma regulatory factor (Ser/Thr protein kinase)
VIAAPSRQAVLAPERTLLLPHASTSASAGRQVLRDDLNARGIPTAVSDAAVLVVSELVSNAVRHARPLSSGKLSLRWSVAEHGIALAVSDGGSTTRPRANPLTRSATGGRGLGIVAALAREWGVRDDSGTTTVWALVWDAPEPREPGHIVVLPTD